MLSKLTLTAIKLRLDKTALFPHLLTRFDGLSVYLGLMHKCPDIFENVDFFLRYRRNTDPHFAYLIRFRLYFITKTLKQWQYDSIPYSFRRENDNPAFSKNSHSGDRFQKRCPKPLFTCGRKPKTTKSLRFSKISRYLHR